MGLQLGLDHEVLEGIATISPRDINRCCSSVFTRWKNQNSTTHPYTWSTIVFALQTQAVGENRLAHKIKSKLSRHPFTTERVGGELLAQTIHAILFSSTLVITVITRYTYAHHVPHTEHMEQSDEMAKCGHWHHSNLFMQAHLCCVVSLLRCRAVLCLSCSQAVSERSESLCCWRASLFLSLSYCCLSSLKRLLYLWTRSLTWRRRLSSKSSIVS